MNVPERALAELRQRGWTQGETESSGGSVCLNGAVRYACGYETDEDVTAHLNEPLNPLMRTARALSEWITSEYPRAEWSHYIPLYIQDEEIRANAYRWLSVISGFNDWGQRTQDEVERALEKCAASWDEEPA